MPFLDIKTIEQALRMVGQRLGAGRPVEILIVGGAAGVLTRQLPLDWTTSDVDVMQFRPPQDIDEILDAAGEVGRQLSLPPLWMNSDVGLWRDSLPDGWESRRVSIGVFGRLSVFAISRQDLIAMKFMAHRPEDFDHLRLLKMTKQDFIFVESYLDFMSDQHDAGKIERARQALEAWKEMYGGQE